MFWDFFRFMLRNGRVSILGVRDTYKYKVAMRNYLKTHPICAYCGRSKKVEVHHKIPVSYAPFLAENENNIITLCRKPQCHLVVGHMGDYKKFNPNVEEICGLFKAGQK